MLIRTLFVSFLALGLVSSLRASVEVGDKPELAIRTLDNKVLTSKDLEGQLVILEFWATWCGPCVKQVPHLKELNAKYAPKGVHLISISNDESRGPAIAFIKQNGMNWTHAMDGEQRGGQMSKAFGVRGIPHAFILSPEGQVLWRGHPASIDEPLEDALKKHPPAPSPEVVREESLVAIAKATELIDKEENYPGAYEAIKDLSDESLKDRIVAAKLRSLGFRFKPVGKRAEPLGKFFEENPQAHERLAELGMPVGPPVSKSERKPEARAESAQ